MKDTNYPVEIRRPLMRYLANYYELAHYADNYHQGDGIFKLTASDAVHAAAHAFAQGWSEGKDDAPVRQAP